MNCYCCFLESKKTQATTKAWSPFMLNAYQGPIAVCENCSNLFINGKRSDELVVSFHYFWGKEADQKFEVVKEFIPYLGEKYLEVKERCKTLGCLVKNDNLEIYILNGELWVFNRSRAVNLGDMKNVVENFLLVLS